MSQLWSKIRYGVRWNPAERLALATRALNLQKVKSIDISMDPLHHDNLSIRTFWHSIMAPKVRLTNPNVRVKTEIRNDRRGPFFVTTLDDGSKLHISTENMTAMDVIMNFNRLTGQPELGKAGTRPRAKI
ncbi:unnamed protein product [Caenorhabditis nigoni]|uniref:Ribosomal protein/NADH dehydrogenase domain-containing protein n=1 Tax=Caenorhabditis nigoni TaxID=1611254 RepID=A0A2G5UUS1_9PELO|nr:hypothetical protein B9Z55_004116 [Caenorhabditis nigoni]